MQIEPFDLRDGISIDLKFAKTPLPSDAHLAVLIVAVNGRTGIGCESNEDASYIRDMTIYALGKIDACALILDFREFEYAWGDYMVHALGAGAFYSDGKFPSAIVVSDLCREGLTSLVVDELFGNPDGYLVDTLELALAEVDRQYREPRRRDDQLD